QASAPLRRRRHGRGKEEDESADQSRPPEWVGQDQKRGPRRMNALMPPSPVSGRARKAPTRPSTSPTPTSTARSSSVALSRFHPRPASTNTVQSGLNSHAGSTPTSLPSSSRSSAQGAESQRIRKLKRPRYSAWRRAK